MIEQILVALYIPLTLHTCEIKRKQECKQVGMKFLSNRLNNMMISFSAQIRIL